MLRRTGGLPVTNKVNDKALREKSSEIFAGLNTSGPFTMLFSLLHANNFCSVNSIPNLFCLLLGMIAIFQSSTISPACLCVYYFLYFISHSSLADGDMTYFLCLFLKGRYFLFLSRKKRDVLILNFFRPLESGVSRSSVRRTDMTWLISAIRFAKARYNRCVIKQKLIM
jgi:hypothetical protein